MFNKLLIIITISTLFLQGCGGGSSETEISTETSTSAPIDTPASAPIDTPTDTSLVFSIFAPSYFDGNYFVSYSLAGTDNNGASYTATQTIKSGTPANTFVNFKPVKVIEVSTSITNSGTNAVIEIPDNKYFTSELNNSNLKYFGYDDKLDVRAIATLNYVIPLTANIGDFGEVGEYTRTDGSSFTQSWKIIDGFNGKAKLIITTTSNATSSDLYPSTIEKLLISQNGRVIGVEISITYHQSGKTITLKNL